MKKNNQDEGGYVAFPDIEDNEEPIHEWVELSYSNYLVIQRSLLQSMSVEWQRKFVKLLEEMQDNFIEILDDIPSKFVVKAKDEQGRFIKDKYADYERGRRRIKEKLNET